VDCSVRLARLEDLEPVCDLFFELFAFAATGRPDLFRAPDRADPEERERLRRYVLERLAAPDEEVLVAEERGGVAGFVHVLVREVAEATSVPFRRGGREGWVHHIAVRPEARRRGVGRALLAAGRGWALGRGAQAVGLQVWAYNEAGRRFFEREGWSTRSFHLYHER
jgi:GNAT superfamily N-acetyltransferase